MWVSNAGPHSHNYQFNQSGQSRSQSRGPEGAYENSAVDSHRDGDRRGQIVDFRDRFERIN